MESKSVFDCKISEDTFSYSEVESLYFFVVNVVLVVQPTKMT